MKRILVQMFSFFGIFILALLLILAKPISSSVAAGVSICLNVLIPSMFVFMVLSTFFIKTGILDPLLKPFGWLCGKLFHIDRSLGAVLLMSVIGGYPVGAKLLTELVQENRLDRKTAQRMLCYCVNSGPAFVIGSVSVPLFGDVRLGFLIFFSHLISFFLIGILTGLFHKAEPVQPILEKSSFSVSLVQSVHSASHAMVNVCAFVLLFSALIGLLRTTGAMDFFVHALSRFVPESAASSIVVGILEVTNGTNQCANVPGAAAFVIATGLTAFGGLSVHAQIKALTLLTKLSMKPFYLFRLLYVAISCTVSFLILQLNDTSIATFSAWNGMEGTFFSFSPICSILFLVLAILLLLSDRKSVTIKR